MGSIGDVAAFVVNMLEVAHLQHVRIIPMTGAGELPESVECRMNGPVAGGGLRTGIDRIHPRINIV